MEVRKGYKQTDVGVIPEDWDLRRLGDLGVFRKGKGIKKDEVISDGLPCIRYGEIYTHYNNIIRKFNSFISEEVASQSQKIKKGDLLFAGSGETAEEIGKCVAFLCDFEAYAGGDVIIFTPHTLNSKFFGYFANFGVIAAQKSRMGQGDAVVHIYPKNLADIYVPLPPLPEQQAIAAALSDVDALLTSLDALIAKTRLIKQGSMQELLTGKKRLPGFEKKKGYKKTPSGVFPEDWDIVPLKQISSMHGRIGWQGLKQTEFTMNSEQPFLITGMNFKDGAIRWDEVYHVPWDRYEMAKEIQLKTGDVLMTKDGTIGKILFVDEIPYPGKATLNSHLLVFRPLNNKYNPKFLFYQLNSKTFFNHVEQEKSGTTFFGITQEAVGKYNAFLPSLPEQTAIAEILSDMDAEIATLEARREKTRLLKQGMMQELLTGRIRLV